MANTKKKAAAEASARDIGTRLASIQRPMDVETERQWVLKAGASTSFFTNLRGNEKRPPADPSINNLRLMLKAVGSSLPEFFLDEAKGRVVRAPNRQALEEAFRDALDELPRAPGQRAVYLAEVVQGLLGLPSDRAAKREAA